MYMYKRVYEACPVVREITVGKERRRERRNIGIEHEEQEHTVFLPYFLFDVLRSYVCIEKSDWPGSLKYCDFSQLGILNQLC